MKWLLAVLILSLSVVLVTSCDPMTSVTFVNETQQKLVLYVQSDQETSLRNGCRSGMGQTRSLELE